MPKEMLNVKVATLETEFDMKLKSNATGKHLFDTIVATTGIREAIRMLLLVKALLTMYVHAIITY